MRRAAQERAWTIRVWKLHKRWNHPEGSECICDEQPGRFRKGQRVLGCNKPRCFICHGEKLMKLPGRQLLKSNASLATTGTNALLSRLSRDMSHFGTLTPRR